MMGIDWKNKSKKVKEILMSKEWTRKEERKWGSKEGKRNEERNWGVKKSIKGRTKFKIKSRMREIEK